MMYKYEVRRPFMNGPERWQQANTVSRHRTLAGAKRALQRQQAGAYKQGGYVEGKICKYNSETGHWMPVDEDEEYNS